MNKPNPLVNRQSEMSIETTPTMRRKAHTLSRCFISIMKLLRVFKCGKKKHKTTADNVVGNLESLKELPNFLDVQCSDQRFVNPSCFFPTRWFMFPGTGPAN